MRKVFCQALLNYSSKKEFIFMTGDLGFMALELLEETMGNRFINAGIAEQNMVSVAAGTAKNGLRPWVYSIGPFIYARPFEQIRNDVCSHNLPVVLVGNGGGYAYGSMGSTHHSLEDYGVLLALMNMNVFVPAFSIDVSPIVDKLMNFNRPAYLRLGRCEAPSGIKIPGYEPWRKLLEGGGPTMLVVGPLVGGLFNEFLKLDEMVRPNLWVVTELPIRAGLIPEEFLLDLRESGHLYVVEEHVAHGSAGQMLCRELLLMGEPPQKFTHRIALGYVSGLYGSQNFHRKECGLDPESIRDDLRN